MSTLIRPEISKGNPYYISKHRYYELKHFCLQYKDWKRIYNDICENTPGGIFEKTNQLPVKINTRLYEKRQKYLNLISIIEDSALLADKELANYILVGVTEDRSFDWLLTIMRIPCCKDVYYDRYRRFFYILSHKRDA